MDTIELRFLFVLGLLALGGVTTLAGALLSSLAERLRSRRGSAAGATAPGARTARRVVLGHGGR
jgi:hypothetical protein